MEKYYKMRKNILVIPGDGVGVEITQCSKLILEKIGYLFCHDFYFDEALMGHTAIEKTNEPLPKETLAKARASHAILFGAIGHPMYDENPNLKVRPEQGLLAIRKSLNLFANLRPIMIFEELTHASCLKKEIISDTDIMFFRELTGDVYFGEKKLSDDGKTASDLMIYTVEEVERISHLAFKAAQQRKKKVCSVDKANVLESSRLWRRVVQEVAKQYADVEVSHMFVDNAAMQLIANPRQFDVVLTSNLFGDILTDEASQITGSLGMLPSASIGGGIGLFEPIHGSAPSLAGKNVANPIASILSAALLLDMGLGLKQESQAVIAAVKATLQQNYRTADLINPHDNALHYTLLGTKEMGQQILEAIKK